MSKGIKITGTNKREQQRRSILSELATLRDDNIIRDVDFEHFQEKIKEGGELQLIKKDLEDKFKDIKDDLKKTTEYQNKVKMSRQIKKVKAMQEQNLDETRGGLQVLINQGGDKMKPSVKKLLTK